MIDSYRDRSMDFIGDGGEGAAGVKREEVVAEEEEEEKKEGKGGREGCRVVVVVPVVVARLADMSAWAAAREVGDGARSMSGGRRS